MLCTCDPRRTLTRTLLTGTGTFGRVRLCEAPDLRVALEKTPPPIGPIIHSANCFFALKIMKKSEVVRLKQVEHIKNEKEILQDVNHPFIVVLCAEPGLGRGRGRGRGGGGGGGGGGAQWRVVGAVAPTAPEADWRAPALGGAGTTPSRTSATSTCCSSTLSEAAAARQKVAAPAAAAATLSLSLALSASAAALRAGARPHAPDEREKERGLLPSVGR